ncbi:SubName: Full=Uncharacterized protein {ECO:0000313/EMBL:CCA67576.1} [Serendipita indica DSM 11827]|uniref:Uncharacterized protein n=1 Tax=Serendipita indica (strain DSM 11827) TaxID=1109443 RepID=G4T8F1_SERID|nr:SubName: Full=Uncharacterized protein {ECO:0000313/EMBL:CCA67576.1} [Serendipita indica DSM 11827]CCA67576.1 hypothetical protein PIIN_01404 [Serendipita indica DSM 11827]
MFGFWKTTTPASQDNQGDVQADDAVQNGLQNASDVSTKKEEAPKSVETKTELEATASPTNVVNDSEVVLNGDESQTRFPFPRPSTSTEVYVSEVQLVPSTTPAVDITGASILTPPSSEPTRKRRISFRSFGFFYGRKPHASVIISQDAEGSGTTETAPTKIKSKRELRKIEKTAFVLQSFILGMTPSSLPFISSSTKEAPPKGKQQPVLVTPSKLGKASNQLLAPEKANKVIAKLRTLPVPDGPELPGVEYAGEHVVSKAEGPIHAVCLDCTEEEADLYHFSRLTPESESTPPREQPSKQGVTVYADTPSIASANLASLVPVLRDIHIVTLVSSPDLGFGQSPDKPGPLAGSVPSAGAVNTGMMEITSQLLALGFATSKAVYPDHAGVYPPTDRMSVLTYWWGLEVCLPPPTLQYLANVKSIQNAALNLLTAISLFNNGVREILPFVRYISQYLDFQWAAIQNQNKGKGVVCAATWVCPAALVPRSWDFPDPPPGQAVVIPKASPPIDGPTIAFPGSKGGGLFTPNAPSLPPVVITPATLPRGAKFQLLKT